MTCIRCINRWQRRIVSKAVITQQGVIMPMCEGHARQVLQTLSKLKLHIAIPDFDILVFDWTPELEQQYKEQVRTGKPGFHK